MLEVNKVYKINEHIILRGINKKFWALNSKSGSQFKLNELSYDILSCILWDNGSDGDGAEAFGHFDRNTGTVLHQKVIDGIMRGAETAEDYEVTFPQ